MGQVLCILRRNARYRACLFDWVFFLFSLVFNLSFFFFLDFPPPQHLMSALHYSLHRTQVFSLYSVL